MIKDFIHFDFETIPSGKRTPLDEIEAPKNIKDPVKIEAAKRKKQEDEYLKQSLNPLKAQIISGAYAYNDDPVEATFSEFEEEEVIDGLWNYVKSKVNTEIVGTGGRQMQTEFAWVGYNIKMFDLQLLFFRAIKYGYYDLAKLIPRNRFSPNVIDLLEVIKGADTQSKGYTQDAVGQYFGIGGKPTEIDGSKVYPFYREGRFQEIVDYNIDDVEKERNLFKIIRKGII